KKAQKPYKRTSTSTGLDLYSIDTIVIGPGKVDIIPTKIDYKIPDNHFRQISTRSNFALRETVKTVIIGGVINSDYQGEIKVIMINLGRKSLTIDKGKKMAPLLLIPIYVAQLEKGQAPTELTV
ncbi:unnamed protein product, partial [Staurois parvus]